jgi:hypothetical protein
MAYAGNPSDLTKQSAPTTSGQYANSWQPLLAAIIVMAIIVVVAMAPVLNRTQVNYASDERGGQSLSLGPTSVVPADRSLEQSKDIQAAIGRMVYLAPLSLAPKSFAPADNSLANAARMQSNVSRMVYRVVAPVDHRYDNIENLRGNLR